MSETALKKVQDSIAVENPATRETLYEISPDSFESLRDKIQEASKAQKAWGETPPAKRARVLRKFLGFLEEHTEELARIITLEHGKTIPDAKGEIARGIEVVEFALGIPSLLKSEYSTDVSRGVDCQSLREPLGVVLGITPFNFPAMLPLWMAPIALACGNAFVLKPSEQVPGAANKLEELFAKAGLPKALFQTVHGRADVAQWALESEEVQAVSFVGSTSVAKLVYEKAAQTGKRVQALGGAKNHLVISPDADLDDATDACISAAFGSAGQRCMSISVAMPIGDIADEFSERMHEKAKALQVGNGLDETSDFGPLINENQYKKVLSYIESGESEGAKLILDGRNQNKTDGYFLGPSIFDHVKAEQKIYTDEIFGPVLSIARAADLEEAITQINDHVYGNGVALYTKNGAIARHFTQKIKVGMVGINVPVPVPVAFHSFGGHKQSLFGDTHIYGPEGVHFYTRLKTITSRWQPGDLEKSLSMPTNN